MFFKLAYISFDAANSDYLGGLKPITPLIERSSSIQRERAREFVDQVRVKPSYKRQNITHYTMEFTLTSCPSSSLVNLGIGIIFKYNTVLNQEKANFTYNPSLASILLYISDVNIQKFCTKDYSYPESESYICMIEIKFLTMNSLVDPSYGTPLGPSSQNWMIIDLFAKNSSNKPRPVYEWPLNKSSNCDCDILEDFPLDIQICDSSECKNKDNYVQDILYGDYFTFQIKLPDNYTNDSFNLLEERNVYLCHFIIQTNSKGSANPICIGFESGLEVTSRSPGKLVGKIKTSMIGNVNISFVVVLHQNVNNWNRMIGEEVEQDIGLEGTIHVFVYRKYDEKVALWSILIICMMAGFILLYFGIFLKRKSRNSSQPRSAIRKSIEKVNNQPSRAILPNLL